MRMQELCKSCRASCYFILFYFIAILLYIQSVRLLLIASSNGDKIGVFLKK